jgi:hypothetical protein
MINNITVQTLEDVERLVEATNQLAKGYNC